MYRTRASESSCASLASVFSPFRTSDLSSSNGCAGNGYAEPILFLQMPTIPVLGGGLAAITVAVDCAVESGCRLLAALVGQALLFGIVGDDDGATTHTATGGAALHRWRRRP